MSENDWTRNKVHLFYSQTDVIETFELEPTTFIAASCVITIVSRLSLFLMTALAVPKLGSIISPLNAQVIIVFFRLYFIG